MLHKNILKGFYMKNVSKRFGFIAMVAVIGLSFAAPVHSGGIVDSVFNGGAKNLAKQTLDLTKKAADLQEKAAEIEEKAAELSDRDRRTYQEELARLGFQPPQGLFNDAQALSSGAPEETQGAGGGVLGGLAGLIRGLGGNRNGSSVNTVGESGGTAAPSGGSSSGNTTAFPGGGKTAAFFNMFDGKNYHMKTKTILEGVELPPEAAMDMISEIFIKGDMMATVSEVMGMISRTVTRDGMMYVIMDATKTVMVMPIPASSDNPSEEPVRTSGMIMTGSGTARFNGKNLPYEEYSLSSEEGYTIKMQWFLDGNNLAGIRTITREMTADMVILALDQNVPNSVFEIPAGYQRMEIPQMPSGY
jgi:hypothetical protein